MTNGEAWRSRLLSNHWFANLPAGLQDSLFSAARQRRVTPGKLLFEKGAASCGLYVLLEGEIRIGTAQEQRLATRLEHVRSPYWFGEVSLFDGLPRSHDAFSMAHSIFLQVPQARLLEILEQNPAYWQHFAQLLGQKLGLSLLTSDRLQLLPVKARVAWRLLMLAEGYGHLSHARRLISFDDLQTVRYLELPRPELLEVLKALHQGKVLRLDDDQVEVFDVIKLRKAANHRRAQAPC